MKKQIFAAAVSLAVVGAVAGCGSSSSTPSSTAAIVGKVADGYLEKATVFLDKNSNYRLDADEPSAITAADGSYTLTVDPADVGQYPIVALAIEGVTYDRADVSATTPITHSYLLSLPKESVSGTVSSNFISPMSTQIREMMETGATMPQAMEELRQNLRLPADTNLMGDYVAGPSQNAPMHTAAQNMATLMGGQMSQVFTGGTTSVDVNRYRGMMGAMFSNISSARGSNYSPTAMTEAMESMTANVGAITAGMPFQNMSSYFRGGMRGGSSMMGR